MRELFGLWRASSWSAAEMIPGELESAGLEKARSYRAALAEIAVDEALSTASPSELPEGLRKAIEVWSSAMEQP